MPGAAADVGNEADALRRGRATVERLIAGGRALGYTLAAENLEHWRDGKGHDRVLPARVFESEVFLLDHLAIRHRGRFIDGARRRVLAGTLTASGGVELDWTDSVVAPFGSDLFYGLGGFTVHSRVRVEISETLSPRRQVTLHFRAWRTDISDDYNWDPGKSTPIPGMGRITDDEMLALEHAGLGRNYKIRSKEAVIRDPKVTADAILL